MSQQVIVLGMHRSYTTLLATWLQENGIQMFDPNISTPRYREDPEIVSLHEEFLRSQQMNWMNARSPFLDPSQTFRNRCYELWQRRNAQSPVWGWKDPRTCILYEFLWSAFTESAKFIVVYRDPAEVLESLLTRKIRRRTQYQTVPDWIYDWYFRRHRKQYDTAHLVSWNYYNRCLIQLLEKKHPQDYLLINATSIVDSETQIYKRITEDWRIPLPGKSLGELMQPSTIKIMPTLQQLNLDDEICKETAQIMNTLSTMLSFKQAVRNQP